MRKKAHAEKGRGRIKVCLSPVQNLGSARFSVFEALHESDAFEEPLLNG